MKYQIIVNFETDRELSPEEQFQIVGSVQVQVEEPADAEGEKMDVYVSEVEAKIIRA